MIPASTAPAGSAPTEAAVLPAQLRAFLTHASLTPVWTAVRNKLERSRLACTGTVQVDLDEDGADRLGGILGTAVRAGRVRVSLPQLDTALRGSAARVGLATVVAALNGVPLVDRAAVRDEAQSQWSGVWARLDAGLAAAGLADAEWVPNFVDAVRRSGLLTRAGAVAAVAAVEAATSVLRVLADAQVLTAADAVGVPAPRWALAELASRCTGDAHGLDDGRLAAALVLRAAATAARRSAPETVSQRRETWAQVAVTVDQVSGTVLIWGLRPPGNDAWSSMLRSRADLRLPTHLTLLELDAADGVPLAEPGQRVWMCENPQVLQAAAHAVVTATLVCLSGNPAHAGVVLLRRLVDAGADVRYHGDFDWPGVAIAGRVFAAGARPWRMTADAYEAAVAALPADARLTLSGSPAATGWDPALAASMLRLDVAVHEEAVLASLLSDLTDGPPGRL